MKLLPGIFLLLLFSHWVWAQENYVANSTNSATPGSLNTLVGGGAGNAGPITSDRNTIVGYNAGHVLTSGVRNSFFGVDAGRNTATGGYNVFIGYQAGQNNNNGNNNVAVGGGAGYSLTSGSGNVFNGYQAGYSTTSAFFNTFIGSNAGHDNTSGGFNTFMGYGSGFSTSSGSNNTFIGYGAGTANTTGNGNTFIGHVAGNINSASNNTFVGFGTGFSNTIGDKNVFLGYQAGSQNTTASANVFIGFQAGYTNTTGIANLFLGNGAGAGSNGSYNLFMGNGSGGNNISGAGNTFIGDGAGYGNAYGQNNTYIGRAANYSGNGFGSQNTFIGFQARTGGGNVNNATAMGVNAVVSQDNSVILGAADARVGIGNSAPQNKLEITQGIANQSGLRLTNLLISSPATAINQTKFLTVNSAGDVILGSLNGSTREGVSESLWQRNGSFLQSTQNDAVIIGSNVARTPAGYKLFVAEGILTEKVKVAVKNTGDWSDKVFDATYHLKGLPEVERYVREHGHLPGVPSAADVVKQGIDVAKMDATLLEKIEELTLYSIQLEKKAAEEQKLRQLGQQKIQQLETEMTELKTVVKQLLEKK